MPPFAGGLIRKDFRVSNAWAVKADSSIDSAGVKLPATGNAFVSVKDADKPAAVAMARRLTEIGFGIIATRGTAAAITAAGLKVSVVNKVLEGRPHCVDRIISGEVQLVINTVAGAQAVADSFDIRRSALTHNVPAYTTVAGAKAACVGMQHASALTVYDLQTLHQQIKDAA